MITVKRTSIKEVDKFEVKDVIAFTLKDGEEVEAMAMKEENGGMIFMLIDCLKEEYPMNEDDTNRGGYEASDLRKALNGEILERFPEEIQDILVPFDNGDILRLPTEKEIFGSNPSGEDEPEEVTQFAPMKNRRRRIAFDGKGGAWQWYWLQNEDKDAATAFANVVSNGGASSHNASSTYGVRPAFKINI